MVSAASVERDEGAQEHQPQDEVQRSSRHQKRDVLIVRPQPECLIEGGVKGAVGLIIAGWQVADPYAEDGMLLVDVASGVEEGKPLHQRMPAGIAAVLCIPHFELDDIEPPPQAAVGFFQDGRDARFDPLDFFIAQCAYTVGVFFQSFGGQKSNQGHLEFLASTVLAVEVHGTA